MFGETIKLALLVVALGLVPQAPTVDDDVDVIELNHVHDGDGRLVLRQLIFWDWRPQHARQHVVAWRLWKVGQPHPLRSWESGGVTLLWQDGAILRCIRAKVYRETWTQFDPEIDDRRRFAPSRRRGLSPADMAGPDSKAEASQR